MKVLYLECNMGAAGDMISAALFGLLDKSDADEMVAKLNNIGLSARVSLEGDSSCGIIGNRMRVVIAGKEESPCEVAKDDDGIGHDAPDNGFVKGAALKSFNTLKEVEDFISLLPFSSEVKSNIYSIYKMIAEAESEVHGISAAQVHFHELGAVDAIVDISAACILIEKIRPDKIIVSPVCLGFGNVKCAHGILPVPAPAVTKLVEGIPTYSGTIEGELCTPTGAAIIKFFADEYKRQPLMTIKKTGYGIGSKKLPAANVLRAYLGYDNHEECGSTDEVYKLECNIDDMTAEELGYATLKLLEEGAKDVYTISAGMKKARPGNILACICAPEDRDEMVEAIFKYTTTLGIREEVCRRFILDREEKTIEAGQDTVRVKRSYGYGVVREKIEYDDLARIADERGISISEVRKLFKE